MTNSTITPMPDFTPRVFAKKLEQYVGKILYLRLDDEMSLLFKVEEVGVDYCAGTVSEDGEIYHDVVLKTCTIKGFHVATAGDLADWGESLATAAENVQ